MLIGMAFLGVILTGNNLEAESQVECTQRLKSLSSKSIAIEEKSGSYLVRADILKANPLLLRNLIAFVYNNPFLGTFFRGADGVLPIHYLERGYELPAELARMDFSGRYSFSDLIALMKRDGGVSKGNVFDLDFSRAEKEGVYLRFLDLQSSRPDKVYEQEHKLRLQFAEALIKRLAATIVPLAVQSFIYTPTADNSFLIEEAFFMHRAFGAMKRLLTSELSLPSWKPYQDSFTKKFEVSQFEMTSDDGKVSLAVFLRRSHPAEPKKALYEVVVTKGELKGDLIINGEIVEWFNSAANSSIGIVSLPEVSNLSELKVEIQSLGGNSEHFVQL